MLGSMGGALPPVVAHLLADTRQFSASMMKAGGELETLEAKGATRFTKLASIGKAAALGIGVAAIGIGVASVHMASQFDQQMERVHTQAGATQHEVDALKGKVLDLGGATGQAPEKLAEALFHVESVGYRGAGAMNVLTQSAKLATISGANLDDVTYGLTSVMQTYGASTKDAAKWGAFFNSVVGAGDMRMQDFSKAVGTGYFSAAQTFGVGAQDAGAALAFMTDRGQHADAAATHLRMTLALMAAPTAKASKLLGDIGLKGPEIVARTSAMTQALQKAGLSTVKLSADLKKPDGIYVALKDLRDHLMRSGLSAEAAAALLARAFGGGKSSGTIMAMVNNLGVLKSKYEAVGKGTRSYGEAWAATQKQFAVQVKQLEASLEALGIKLGNVLIPKLQAAARWSMSVVQWFEKHKTVAQALAIVVGGVLLVAMGAWIATLAIAAGEMIAATWPILAIIAACFLLVLGILWLKNHWSQVWGWIVEHVKAVGRWIGGVIQGIIGWFKRFGQYLLILLGPIGAVIFAIMHWRQIVAFVKSLWADVERITSAVWDKILGFFKKWWPLLLVVFAFPIAVLLAVWNRWHKQILAVVHAAWALVERYIVAPLTSAWHWVERTASNIWHSLVRWFNQAKSTAARIWHEVYTAVTAPYIQAWHMVESVGSRIWSAITSAFGRVLGWLGGIGSQFYSVGSSIVEGIINGVTGAGGALVGKMQSLASSALNAAKSFLGINSPSKVFARVVGWAIPEGIGAGVDQRAGVAHSSVRALASRLVAAGSVAVTPSVAASVSSATAGAGVSPFAVSGVTAGAGGEGVINVNLTSEAKVDGQVLFTTTQRHSLRYQKRNARPAFTY